MVYLAVHFFPNVSQMSSTESDNSSDDGDQFWSIIQGAGKLTEAYVVLYMFKAPPRTSQLSGMGWVNVDGEIPST
jgi:hypothetical protein